MNNIKQKEYGGVRKYAQTIEGGKIK